MSNIRSLSDLRKEEKKNKERVAHYTGGQNSGLEVENSDDDMAPSFFTSKLPENCRRITLYKNGFIVDDGEFRDLNLEENKKFMQNIEAGILPKELAGKDKTMNVALKDKSNQVYTKEKMENTNSTYKGQGVKLGSTNAPSFSEEEIKKLAESAPRDVKNIDIDDSKPITTLHVRLYNGKKVSQKFNYDHTVEDLFEFVYSYTPINFSLFFDFPLKKIERSGQTTLQDAKLIDTLITQKLTS
ncbi:ubiquitin regulatory protein, putative [Plasmodium knowlesi strain H]|uniref:Ubiquitin regulatory protein, putative n=3 Tax=Plasmodium knowlesi TaxID=5850 RepID=A0A5E7WUY6_PLAKH|nr:ubiquitin regulatory protein, putative [Plasmodium knowlesi strain H]OTN68651.1 putative Ubiquitin regulatory protein [Plasmodium knowlesi]CAA9986185.1 ubiquitin regulatory protein, putative [Plasmodium knowlesi strain H]SBO25384.1 ubiquitin regulatory protein, putative [Plasmodium knowlesi strain H]SBO27679.1 ubiquitin regulatory protein, putative [Plasmodium knowlesi strain H]VVS75659.1 ubiquitin regulatory protein, putative [Plasmodium knowlesi strain H]